MQVGTSNGCHHLRELGSSDLGDEGVFIETALPICRPHCFLLIVVKEDDVVWSESRQFEDIDLWTRRFSFSSIVKGHIQIDAHIISVPYAVCA